MEHSRPGSSVGIATDYGLDGQGIESRWGRDFSHLFKLALGPTQPPVRSVPGLYRGKERPGHEADTSPLLVPWSRKSRSIPLLPLWAVRPVESLSACTRVQFTFYHFTWKVNTCRQIWLQYTKGTEKEPYLKWILHYRPEGRRDIYRPRQRWSRNLDQVKGPNPCT